MLAHDVLSIHALMTLDVRATIFRYRSADFRSPSRPEETTSYGSGRLAPFGELIQLPGSQSA